jgi:hypothetical protein
LLFFTWFDDLEQLALESNYTETLKTFNYIPWNVAEYAKSNEIYNIPGDGHFKSEEQKRIYDGFIHPHVVEMIKNHTSPHA